MLRFIGTAGLIIVCFGTLAGLLTGSFVRPFVAAHYIGGFLLIGVWALFSEGGLGGSVKRVFSGRESRVGFHFGIQFIALLGILIGFNWIVSTLGIRWDLTEGGVYSLAPETVKVLDDLEGELVIVGFSGTPAASEPELRDIFGRYTRASSKVKTEIVNPRTQPYVVERYGMQPGQIIYMEYGEGEERTALRAPAATEAMITNAILRLVKKDVKKIYFVEGHAEPSFNDDGKYGIAELGKALQREHYNIEGLLLSVVNSIPEDAAAVALIAPKKKLLEEEVRVLEDYARGGGRLLLVTDPLAPEDIPGLAQKFKLSVGQNVVIDQVQRKFNAPELGAQPLIKDYPPHPITRNLTERDVTVFNIASTVGIAEKSVEGEAIVELLKTSATAWAETNLKAIFQEKRPSAVLDRHDTVGPISLGAAYEKKLEADQEGVQEDPFDRIIRVAVYGDSDWLLNGAINVYANLDLALNTFHWLSGQSGGVQIRRRAFRPTVRPVFRSNFLMLASLSFLIPELLFLLGFFVWWRRRRD